MPSLRERSSRPSYALMAGGLEDLSDEDASANGSPDAEGSNSAKKRTTGGAASPGSSGDSSDPGPARKIKSKGKGKGKGKDKALINDDSGSDFQAGSDEEEEEDDDVEMDVDENEDEGKEEDDGDDDDDALVELVDDDDGDDTKPKQKAGAWGKGSNTRNWSGPRSAQAAYVQTEANLVPPAYRALIKKYAETLAPPVRGAAGPPAKDYRTRAFIYELLPFGPNTPFQSRLRNPPSGRGLDEVYIAQGTNEDEDWERRKEARNMRAAEVTRTVTLIEPWQTWQGEGWWPEMASLAGQDQGDGASNAAGPSKIPQTHGKKKATENAGTRASISTGRYEWKMRDEVRLGLDHVGRYKHEQMVFLSSA